MFMVVMTIKPQLPYMVKSPLMTMGVLLKRNGFPKHAVMLEGKVPSLFKYTCNLPIHAFHPLILSSIHNVQVCS